jgi:ribosomal protein L40E
LVIAVALLALGAFAYYAEGQTSQAPVLPVSYFVAIVVLAAIVVSFCWGLISGRRRMKPAAAIGGVEVQFCINCGAKLPPESKFCNKCGSAQT